ncbi:MAG: glycosyltransferase [Nitrospira sp.]
MPTYRVLHILKFFRPQFTGEGVFIERMSPVLDVLRRDTRHDMLATVTPDPKTPYIARSTLTNVAYLYRAGETQSFPHLRLFWWMLRSLWRYDVVHFHTHADRFFLSYLLAKLFGRRLVLSATLNDSVQGIIETYRPLYRPLVRRLCRLFDAYVSISPKLHEETTPLVPCGRAHLVPMGINIPEQNTVPRAQARRTIHITDETVMMICVGGICQRKDQLFLVRQVVAMRDLDLTLVLVGPVLELDYYARLQAVIDDAGIGNRVIFAGRVEEPWAHYAASDIMVFASKEEGFGTAMIEGMAYGMPIVARLLPGVNDAFIEHGKSGYLFAEDAQCEGFLRELAQDKARRQAFGATGRQFVSAHYRMESIAAHYLQIYGIPVTSDAIRPASSIQSDAGEEAMDELADAHRHVLGYRAQISVTDHRFHQPLELRADTRPLLVVLIDAEEDFDWAKPLSRHAIGVKSMARQHLAHAIFDRYAVKPTYLVDFPVASQAEGFLPLRDLLADARCEIGAQMHPWVAPPFVEPVTTYDSFLCNLPMALQYAKIRRLKNEIEDKIGVVPTMFRAGRYGIGNRTAEILVDLGFRIDTSVVPRWSFAEEGGPDFSHHVPAAYWANSDRTLLELPLSCDFVGKAWLRQSGVSRFAMCPSSQKLRLPGLLARMGMLERIKLTPEGMTLDEAKRLTRTMLDDGQKIFALSYHSPSLNPGNTPYVRYHADLAQFLAWLDGYFEFFLDNINGHVISGSELWSIAKEGQAGLGTSPPKQREVNSQSNEESVVCASSVG